MHDAPLSNGIRFTPTPDGLIRVEKLIGEEQVSRLHIVPFTVRIGRSRVRVDGIADVATRADHRQKGYASEVLRAAVQYMERGNAAISVLYGIHDFYDRFGFATGGADAVIHLTALDRRCPEMPSGWRVEPLAPGNVRRLKRLYDQESRGIVCAAVRRAGADWAGNAWRALDEAASVGDGEACRVLIGPRGRLGGYAWRSRQAWFVHHTLEEEYPNALVIGEAMADSPAPADAVLAACRRWALEERTSRNTAVERMTLCHPHTGHIAAAAMRDDAVTSRTPYRCGGFMARTLSVRRLLRALEPELTHRARAAGLCGPAAVRLETEVGAACLTLGSAGVQWRAAAAMRDAAAVRIGQADLARLVLGAFQPEDVLARLPCAPTADVTEMLSALFPRRDPFVFPAERP